MAKTKQIAKVSPHTANAKHSIGKAEKTTAPSRKRRKLRADEGWVEKIRNHLVQSKEPFSEVHPESVRMSILWEDDSITPEPMTNMYARSSLSRL